MKHYFIYISLIFFSLKSFAQNVQVDNQSYTPQQLIEDILIDSNCITNVNVTNVIGGDFGGTDQSYGYFDASGTTFPIQSGIVLSTGRLNNVEGPNTTLSDDDATNWIGDNDLESILNETNTHNATIIEFDFTPIVTTQISFRYLFASEEYQEGNPNTCQYSDLFGFLIRPVSDTQYTNIALVPNTQTPVKVTTVHPDIPNGCVAQNETYFGSWNNASAPINFNGQTITLTAIADVIANETYHVKLVIADEQNYRFDSAVFLEAGSFQLNTNLGPDRLISTNNPLCENEILTLNAFQPGSRYKWYKDGIPESTLFCLNCFDYEVTEPGTYGVEVMLDNGCISTGEITIEYVQNPSVINTNIVQCDSNQDGITIYNLYDAEQNITNENSTLSIEGFFLTQQEAEQNNNAISTPSSYSNISAQIVYARIENQYRCFSIAEIILDISNENINIPPFEICDDAIVDGFTDFIISDLITHVEQFIPNGLTVHFFLNEENALNGTAAITGIFTNSIQNSETIYVKTEANGACYAIAPLELNIIFTPELQPDETISYCLNTFPQTVTLNAGVLNNPTINFTYQWFFNNQLLTQNIESIEINETGNYSVIVTHSNGCSTTRNITVLPSNIATINDIIIEDASVDNTITVNVSGEGIYQFALDNQIYTDANTFTNVKAGIHIIFIRDINGCETITREVAVLGFPKFFTPNNDGKNDTWKPLGVNAQFNSEIKIKIFNRYGKLIKSINPVSTGWNGTFNGNNLPNDDYWYTVFFPNGKEYRGHFALVR